MFVCVHMCLLEYNVCVFVCVHMCLLEYDVCVFVCIRHRDSANAFLLSILAAASVL